MTVVGNVGETCAVIGMHQWDHSESIALISMYVRCVVVVLKLMGSSRGGLRLRVFYILACRVDG